jgi:hypothetical protein
MGLRQSCRKGQPKCSAYSDPQPAEKPQKTTVINAISYGWCPEEGVSQPSESITSTSVGNKLLAVVLAIFGSVFPTVRRDSGVTRTIGFDDRRFILRLGRSLLLMIMKVCA